MKRLGKLFAVLLAPVMVLGMSATVLADGEDENYTDASTVTITKVYKSVGGGVSPAETFTFSEFTPADSVEENSAATFPETLPTITNITAAEGAATAAGAELTATITLPTYTAVGIYKYTFSEVTPATKTAGVSYAEGNYTLVVTVIEQDGKVRVGAVHCESPVSPSYEEGSTKTDKL